MNTPTPIEFVAWPKTPRFFRDIVITEKIDGTNAAIHIQRHPFGTHADPDLVDALSEGATVALDGEYDETGTPEWEYVVVAQSRKRLLAPGKTTDNFGFAAWVRLNAASLAETLGEGLHYGEWWGQGIQRGYGLQERRFSLFNVGRYGPLDLSAVEGLGVVPHLYQGSMGDRPVKDALRHLEAYGSFAAPGFLNPEGIIIWHSAAGQAFKVLLENDELPKGLVA